mgnify:CR=1 FL=1
MTWIINWAIQGALKCFRSRCKQINKLPKKDLRPRTTWSISNSRLKWCSQKLMNLLRGKACSITRIRRRSGPRRSYIIWLTKSTRIRRLAISNVISKKGNWQVSNNDRRQPTWEAQIHSNIKTKVTFWARQVLCHLKMPAKKFLKMKKAKRWPMDQLCCLQEFPKMATSKMWFTKSSAANNRWPKTPSS